MQNEKIQEISHDLISDPKDAMRSELDREGLFALADNIKQNGLINPITVRPLGQGFEVVAGHRRLSACKIAGLIKIPCVIRSLDENQAFEIMAAENLERADVDLVDESNFLTRYIQKTGKSVAQVAQSIKRSAAYVESRLTIGLMPDYMQQYLKNGSIKLGVALFLFQITEDRMRHLWCDMAARDGISVAQAEHWLHGWKMNQLPGGSDSIDPPGNFQPGEVAPIMFECAIDGKKYDARLFKTVMIYEGNMPVFNAIVEEIRKDIDIPSPQSGEGI